MNRNQILKRPVITEKSLSQAALGRYTFEVESRARKKEISQAVQRAFGVHVLRVWTINLKGKKRRVGPRRKEAITSSWTKAIVQLKPEEKIDLFTVPGQEEAKGK